MVPGRPVLQHGKVVCPRGTPGNRTLRHADTVLVVVVILSKTVPVDHAALVIKVVGDMDDDRVSPASFNQGSRICAIEETGFFGDTIGSNGMFGNVDMVLS